MVLTIHLNTPPGGRSRIAKNFRSIRPMGIRASRVIRWRWRSRWPGAAPPGSAPNRRSATRNAPAVGGIVTCELPAITADLAIKVVPVKN
jgi:hypothetical protein